MHFAADRMVRPVSGEILIGYSMESSVYFATLDQYKHHPGIVYKAMEGESVNACNAGRVIDIREDAQHGQMLELDLGDGIHAIYGQLGEIEVPVGAEVAPGMKIAGVAKPTKYFSVEGTNLYFELTQDGKSIDPGNFFGEGDL